VWQCIACKPEGGNNSDLSGEEQSDENASIKEMLRRIEKKVEEIPALIESVSFMSKQYDDLMEKIDKNNNLTEDLIKKVDVLSKDAETKDQIIEELSDRLNVLEQANLSMCVEIHNYEQIPGEELKVTVKRLADRIQAPPIESTVCDMYRRMPNMKRQGASGVPGVIVMKFNSADARNVWLERRRLNNITSGSVNNNNCELKIRVFEMLTPQNKKLLWQTRTTAKAANYTFIWVKNGRIFIKENENKGTVRIFNEKDLKNKIPGLQQNL
jgi:hypothetical protein